MEYNKQIHIRISENDKIKCEKVLKDINENRNKKVGYRFLLMEFVNNYLDNNITGLEIERNQLIKENEKDKAKKDKLTEIITDREIKIKKLNNEINNKSIYDLSNYKYNQNLNNAVQRIKEIILTDHIKTFNNIPDTLFLQMKQTFKINDIDLLKNIVNNEFPKWQKELLIIDPTPETTKEDIIKDISEKMLNRFNKPGQHIKNLNDYLKTDQAINIIKGYTKKHHNINENDIINYMLELPEKKKIKK